MTSLIRKNDQKNIWRLIYPKYVDPFFNLALEETLFQNVTEEKSNFILRFWKTNPCCVLGKHQFYNLEINEQYCKNNGISIARRITGGGTVYLDLGCLNFTLIFKNEGILYSEDHLESFKIILYPIINAIKSLSFDVQFHPPNSIYYKGKKISGSAQLRRGKFILFHGTLLLNSNLDALRKSLTTKRYVEGVRVIKSNKVETINLFQNKNEAINDPKIMEIISKKLKERFNLFLIKGDIKSEEIKDSNRLLEKKYLLPSWNS